MLRTRLRPLGCTAVSMGDEGIDSLDIGARRVLELSLIRLGNNLRGLIVASLTKAYAKDRNMPTCPSPSQCPCSASGFVNVKQ